jgi:hypothetical protein
VSVEIKNFLKARRDRCLGSILGYTEREIFPKLTGQERLAFRNLVLDSLNSYHDSVLDLVKSEQGTVRNEELVAMLERVDKALVRTRSFSVEETPKHQA